MKTSPRATWRTCLGVMLVLTLAGFGPCEDNAHDPGAPDPDRATLDNCWPNADRTSMAYLGAANAIEGGQWTVYPRRRDVPTVSLEDADRLIARTPVPTEAPHAFGYTLAFTGEITTGSGVRAQFLMETFPSANHASGSSDAFLSHLAQVRPDLAQRIRHARPALSIPRSAPLGGSLPFIPPQPRLVHGGAFVKGPLWIGTYGDLDTLLAWKFLDVDLHERHEFAHPLVPSLAPDVVLRGRVAARGPMSVPAYGDVPDAVEMHYLIDYGVMEAQDIDGNPIGYARSYEYGRVFFVPNVGPVYAQERLMAWAGPQPDMGAYETTFWRVMTRSPRRASLTR